MRVLEKIALFIFSVIVLILAVLSCLIVFNVVEISDITAFIADNIHNETVARTVVIVSAICIVLAIKSIFFPVRIKKKEEIKSGVLLENQDGRLLISKDTIENLITSIVKSFPDAVDSQTKVFLDAENNITVFISLLVNEDAVIKELSANIQSKIKETVKRNTDLDVKQININVKNIDSDKEQNKREVQKKETKVAKINIENVQVNKEESKETNEWKTVDENSKDEATSSETIQNS